MAVVALDLKANTVEVSVIDDGRSTHRCPTCDCECPGYDRQPRRWRHLDTCQMQTVLVAELPRVQCPTHGVLLVRVPWAEAGSRFTAMFETVVIDLLRIAPIKAVAAHTRLTWDQVDGIQARAVARGLRRREAVPVRQMALDETSVQHDHEYVAVVSDRERRVVVHVADDRKATTLTKFYQSLPPEHLAAIELVTMDMWGPYISATRWTRSAGRSIASGRRGGHSGTQDLGESESSIRHRASNENMHLAVDFYWTTPRCRTPRCSVPEPAAVGADAESRGRCSQSWAMFIKRVYEVDPLSCPEYGGQMKVITFVEPPQGDLIENLLKYRGLWQASSARPPATGVTDARGDPPGGVCYTTVGPHELTSVDQDTFEATF